jgi:hypothetical protein
MKPPANPTASAASTNGNAEAAPAQAAPVDAAQAYYGLGAPKAQQTPPKGN